MMHADLDPINFHKLTILTLKEAAKMLKICPATLQRLAKKRLIPSNKVGRSWRFAKEYLQQYLREPYQKAIISKFKRENMGP